MIISLDYKAAREESFGLQEIGGVEKEKVYNTINNLLSLEESILPKIKTNKTDIESFYVHFVCSYIFRDKELHKKYDHIANEIENDIILPLHRTLIYNLGESVTHSLRMIKAVVDKKEQRGEKIEKYDDIFKAILEVRQATKANSEETHLSDLENKYDLIKEGIVPKDFQSTEVMFWVYIGSMRGLYEKGSPAAMLLDDILNPFSTYSKKFI